MTVAEADIMIMITMEQAEVSLSHYHVFASYNIDIKLIQNCHCYRIRHILSGALIRLFIRRSTPAWHGSLMQPFAGRLF